MAPDAKNKTFSPGLTSRSPPPPSTSVNTETVYTTRSCVHLLFARWPSARPARESKTAGLHSAAIKKPLGAFLAAASHVLLTPPPRHRRGWIHARTIIMQNKGLLRYLHQHMKKKQAPFRGAETSTRPRTPTTPANVHAGRYLRV